MGWAIADGVTPTVLATVDSTFKALRQSPRPIEFGAGTHIAVAKRTGTMAAALAANAVIWSFRWGDGTLLALLMRLRVMFQTLTVFTAHQEVSFEAYVGRSFSASHTGGTAATLTTNSGKKRTSLTTSKIATNGDWRIASTAALGGGTVTLDNDPFTVGLGSPNVVNAAAGTAYSPYNRPEIDYHAWTSDGRHPHVFAQNEGAVIRNGVVWPVAGTAVLSVESDHVEVAVY